MADYYEHYWSEKGYNPRRHGAPPYLVELFQRHVRSTDDCLDLGCGDGGTSGLYLSRNAKNYLGVDVSQHAVELAVTRGLKARTVADASRLPFEDRSFDVVACIEVLEHLFEPRRAVGEVFRVLRPGGRVIVTVPNASYWRNRADMLFGVWQPGGDENGRAEPWRSPHIRFFQRASLARMLDQAGFDPVEVSGIAIPLFGRVPILRQLNRKVGPAATWLTRVRPTLFAHGLAAVGYRQTTAIPSGTTRDVGRSAR